VASGRERARGDVMRLKKMVLIFAGLTMMVVLAACASLSQSSGGGAGGGGAGDQEKPPVEEAQKEGAPKKIPEEAKDQQIAPAQGAEQEDSGDTENLVEPPEDKTLRLTIPKMDQIEDDKIPTGRGDDDQLFHDYAAVHLKRSGYPWEKVANVYIAGHRLGFPGTPSHLAFYDLNELEDGDEFTITDAQGRVYTYEVFNKFIAGPKNFAVIRPLEGKNIVSLQTCTLPDYTTRLIVRGELKNIEEA
jgi:sortase A